MVREVLRYDKLPLFPTRNVRCGEIGGAETVPPGCHKAYAEYDVIFENHITQWYCHHCAVELVPIW